MKEKFLNEILEVQQLSGLKKVINTARDQLKMTENPPDSNNVIYNTHYYGREVSGPDYPWCVTFLWDVFRMAGQSNAFCGGQKTASCTFLKNYYAGLNRWLTVTPPSIGDIVIMSFHSNHSVDHCGLLIDILPDNNGTTKFITIEGNTSPGEEGSQDNGGCVALKIRDSSSILGFCHIIYSNQSDSVTEIPIMSGGPVNSLTSDYITNNSSILFKTKTVTQQQTRDVIQQIDINDFNVNTSGTNLLSYPSLVEAPYINVKIGDYVFGKYNEQRTQNIIKVTYPNFITSMSVVKINGQVNMYTINMLYQIQAGDDPNFIDKILSSVGYGKIKISYGDYASPSFVYKEEEAIIIKVSQKVNFSTSSINYVISCTSSALQLLATNYSYQYYPKEKPSNIIKQMLRNASYYKLNEVFPGLTGKNLDKNFSKFIATDDLAVEIPAKSYMDPVSYINYLVSYMVPEVDSVSATQRSATYFMTIHDDSYADYSDVGGTYFKITKVFSTYTSIPTANTYTVDVGYPGGDNPGENLVMDFSVTDDNSWSLLYNYSQNDLGASQQNYTYSINNQGQMVQNYSPNITLNAIQGKTTASMKSWWTKMTEFPISATIVIKGLVRSAMLMSYLRVNAYFYGQKHISSGLYIITKQEDKIDGQGYRTTLSLTRIAGADEYIQRKNYTTTSQVVTGVEVRNNKIPDIKILDPDVPSYFEMIETPEGSNIQLTLGAGSIKWVVVNKNTGKVITNINEDPINRMLSKNSSDLNDNNPEQYTICPIDNVAAFFSNANEYYQDIKNTNPLDRPQLYPEIYFDDNVIGYAYQFENIDNVYAYAAIIEGNNVYWHPDVYSQHDLKQTLDGYVQRIDGEPVSKIYLKTNQLRNR